MNKHVIAASLARRVPAMALDSAVNNEQVILNLLSENESPPLLRLEEQLKSVELTLGQLNRELPVYGGTQGVAKIGAAHVLMMSIDLRNLTQELGALKRQLINQAAA